MGCSAIHVPAGAINKDRDRRRRPLPNGWLRPISTHSFRPGRRAAGRKIGHAKSSDAILPARTANGEVTAIAFCRPKHRRRLLSAAGLLVLGWLAGMPAAAADTRPSRIGRLLAGLERDAYRDRPARRRVLQRHNRIVQRYWRKYQRRIGRPMHPWVRRELKPRTDATIFYPFGGPDLATVQRLFPAAARYVLVSIQRAGRPPAPERMGLERFRRTLRVFRIGLDWFGRKGFFLTKQLNRQYHRRRLVEGISGILLLFAERGGFEVRALTPIRLGHGRLEPYPAAAGQDDRWDSVRLLLRRRADDRRVVVDYFRLDLSDDNLEQTPAARAWLRQMSTNPVLLKAASHLLQKERFSTLRDLLLEHAPSIVQDETGIAYGTLSELFEVVLYGDFARANTSFDRSLQRRLKRAYDRRQDVEPLPFIFGYRKKAGSCLIRARRPEPLALR